MKKLAVFAVAAVLAASAFAQNAWELNNSYITTKIDGASEATWYGGSGSGHEAFNGQDLGTISSLILGGEVTSVGDADGENNPAFLNYSIDNGAASKIQLNWTEWVGGDSNKFYGEDSVNTLAQYNDGETHDLKVYFSKPSGNQAAYEGNIYESNADHDYVAHFQSSAVPEPATMSLLGLGALAMVLRRKLRK